MALQCSEGAATLLQLAHIHMSGLGITANCSKAASFVRVVLQERSGWSEDIADAVAALDEGEPEFSPYTSPGGSGHWVLQLGRRSSTETEGGGTPEGQMSRVVCVG